MYDSLRTKLLRLQESIESRECLNATQLLQIRVGTKAAESLKAMAKRHSSSPFTEVALGDGSVSKDKQVIEEEIRLFYEKLYSSDSTCKDSQERLLQLADDHIERLSGSEADLLVESITKEEVLEALREAPKGKSPGPDGIPVELYVSLKKVLTPWFVQLFNLVLNSGEAFPEGNEVNISLIFKKKGNRNQIKNWRPISLSNTDYKILTRILSDRMMFLVGPKLHSEQSGFLKGRSIWDNIVKVQNVLEDQSPKNTGYLMLLDMEKAYDRVSWDYLYFAMRALNIPTRFIGWVKTLYLNLNARVIVNGKLSDRFDVFRGLRQGDPMSPILFNIGANLLITAGNKLLRGLFCRGQHPLRTLAFADDTVLGLGCSEDVKIAEMLLDVYQRASNAKLNVDKTVMVPISNPKFGPFKGVALHEGSALFKYLGILFTGQGLAVKAMENSLIEGVQDRVNSWKYAMFNLEGKITALNVFIFSKLWYVAHILPMSERLEKGINRIVMKFLWNASKSPVTKGKLNLHVLEGGYGLLDFKVHAHKIFSKQFHAMLYSHSNGPLSARAIIWCKRLRVKGNVTSKSFRRWFGDHPKLISPGGASEEVRAFLGAIRTVGWSFEKLDKEVLECLDMSECIPFSEIRDPFLFEKQMNYVEDARVKIRIGEVEMDKRNYPLPKKKRKDLKRPVIPSQIRCWQKEGKNINVDPVKVNQMIQSKLVSSNQRSLMWRVMHQGFWNEARMPVDHPVRSCPFCCVATSTVTHKYLTCPALEPYWERVYDAMGVDLQDRCVVEDVFFGKSLQAESVALRGVLYQYALWAVHCERIRIGMDNGGYNAIAMVCRFKTFVDACLARVSKFGFLIPGGRSARNQLVQESSLLEVLHNRPVFKWVSNVKSRVSSALGPVDVAML